jgi:hypothetical protein
VSLPASPALPSGALLSVDASNAARALRRWAADDLERFADAVVAALAMDVRRWGADAPLLRLHEGAGTRRVMHAEDVEPAARPADWCVVSEGGAWWHLPGSPVRLVRRMLFGEGHGGSGSTDAHRIADEVAADVWSGQLQALAQLVAGSGESGQCDGEAQAWCRWSGAVHLSLPWGGTTLQLLFPASRVAHVLSLSGVKCARAAPANQAALTPFLGAVAGLGARLELRLDAFEIDLGSLVGLAVGDVLHVGHALDKPVRVCAVQAPLDGDPLCLGWLGQRDGALAVELARVTRTASQPAPQRTKSSL